MKRIIQLNKCLFLFRVLIRKKIRINNIVRKLKIKPILQELNNIKPNIQKIIFRDGTNFYKNKKCRFNNIAPYHIMPGQLINMKKSNDTLYIKEKADGILVNIIPSDIFPPIKFTNMIKAEYIEELNLYLVYDIDIPYIIEERYQYLREQHLYTINMDINKIHDTFISLINSIDNERQLFKKFLEQPYDSYRWYPKAAWKIIMNDNIVNELTALLNGCNEKEQWLCNNGIVKNDGLILTPLNGNREIKIKPKRYLTIDLLYSNKNWLDRSGKKYNNIIVFNEEGNYNNTIWRCYPENMKYIPREIRYDKYKPNTTIIVSNIINLFMIEHKQIYPHIYRIMHNMHNNAVEWSNITHINTNIIKNMVKHLSCNNVLDLGCGNGKILQYIDNYKFYHGIDMDVNMLASIIPLNLNNNIILNNLDLSIDWNQPGIKWYDIDNIIYDSVVAINSIQYFNTDIFWFQLNKVVNKGSNILFNVVSMDNMKKYETEEIYMERKDNIITYKFKPIHSMNMTEIYIDDINIMLDKYKWEIKTKYNDKSLLLPSYYTWYIAVKL